MKIIDFSSFREVLSGVTARRTATLNSSSTPLWPRRSATHPESYSWCSKCSRSFPNRRIGRSHRSPIFQRRLHKPELTTMAFGRDFTYSVSFVVPNRRNHAGWRDTHTLKRPERAFLCFRINEQKNGFKRVYGKYCCKGRKDKLALSWRKMVNKIIPLGKISLRSL